MLRSRFEKTEYGIPVVINRIANPELADPPTLNTVVRKAEATPLLVEGTEPMMELMLGEINMPFPTPSNTIGMANFE